MDLNEEYQKERLKNALKWVIPVSFGVIALIISTILDLSDAFQNTPQYIFRITNGVSIALIVVFGLIWSQTDKKIQDNYTKVKNKTKSES